MPFVKLDHDRYDTLSIDPYASGATLDLINLTFETVLKNVQNQHMRYNINCYFLWHMCIFYARVIDNKIYVQS